MSENTITGDVEIIVEDPSTGNEHIFTGATAADAEAAADRYFNPEDLSNMTPAELAAELATIREQLTEARARRDRDAVVYASTPDGAAETYRRFELSAPGEERRRLESTYLGGLVMAAEEYEQRRRRGNAGPNDGPLAVVPAGDLSGSDPVVNVVVAQRIMGTFRNTEAALDTDRVVVTLLRLLPGDKRKRMRVEIAAALGVLNVPLSQVLLQAWADPTIRGRLVAFLGDEAAAALGQAVGR